MDEFEFIAKYLRRLGGEQALNLQDDIALWTPPRGMDVVLSMDTIVEGVHFPQGKFDGQVAQKLLRVNISDCVAKGAKPLGYLLSLSLPKNISEKQLAFFCEGLAVDQQIYGLKLWGGDTTRSKAGIVLSATLIASLPTGEAVLRSGANISDYVCVSGVIGEGYLGLKILLNQMDKEKYECKEWLERYHLPCPPFAQTTFIREVATSALDISDGLIADATHLATASHIGLEIDLAALPLSCETRKWVKDQADRELALIQLASGGDDYQVLMTISADVKKSAAFQKSDFTVIGRVVGGQGVACFLGDKPVSRFENTGYRHF